MVSPFCGTVRGSGSGSLSSLGGFGGGTVDWGFWDVRERSTVARGGPGGSSIRVTTDVLSARMRVFDHLGN